MDADVSCAIANLRWGFWDCSPDGAHAEFGVIEKPWIPLRRIQATAWPHENQFCPAESASLFQQRRQLHQLLKPCAPFVGIGNDGFAVADFVGAAGGELEMGGRGQPA